MKARIMGKATELAAKRFLEQQGLIFIAQNYYCRNGEIDLIMRDNKQIVFIEVKYRQSVRYGSGFEMVTYQKQQKIIRTAQHYLYKYNMTESYDCRFDVISITPNEEALEFSIQWLKNAFSNE